MEKFNKNIDLSRKLFLDVFVNNDIRINFLENALNDENYFKNLESSKKSKLDEAVEILISNARVEETRKMQQAHFGPLLGKIRTQDPKEYANALKNNEEMFIDFLQLLIIFMFRKDIESENHHHDDIRELLQEKCKKILKEIKE